MPTISDTVGLGNFFKKLCCCDDISLCLLDYELRSLDLFQGSTQVFGFFSRYVDHVDT